MTNFDKVSLCNRVTINFSSNAFPETNSDLAWERGPINKQDGLHATSSRESSRQSDFEWWTAAWWKIKLIALLKEKTSLWSNEKAGNKDSVKMSALSELEAAFLFFQCLPFPPFDREIKQKLLFGDHLDPNARPLPSCLLWSFRYAEIGYDRWSEKNRII